MLTGRSKPLSCRGELSKSDSQVDTDRFWAELPLGGGRLQHAAWCGQARPGHGQLAPRAWQLTPRQRQGRTHAVLNGFRERLSLKLNEIIDLLSFMVSLL